MVKVFPGEAHSLIQLQAIILPVMATEIMLFRDFRFCVMDNVELPLVSIKSIGWR